jgi:predicted Abi (CAAX) family protease
MLPRGAQDGMGKNFSRLGAGMWFLNTYQVGGVNPDIVSIAPTIWAKRNYCQSSTTNLVRNYHYSY